jgi:hypothetical protein
VFEAHHDRITATLPAGSRVAHDRRWNPGGPGGVDPGMTTRRRVLTMMGGAALLAACREPDRSPPAPPAAAAPDGLIVAATRTGLVTVRGDRRLAHGTAAVGSGDGDRVYAATPTDEGTTALTTVDLRTGTEVGRALLAGTWVPRVVGPYGRLVALTPPGAAGAAGAGPAGRPAGRTRTPMLIAGPDGERHRLDLPGNVEPDAVSPDGAALFVLEWLPAQAPDRYRVRMVDLPGGSPQPLLTRDKLPVPAEEEMRGAGRQAVLSPDREILYTLYTHQADHQHTRDLVAGRPGGVHAFVHVLHLAQRWAYCLDLPEPFGHGPAAGHALALSPDGRRLLVADITGGRLADADTESLTLTGVTPVPTGPGVASLAAAPGRRFLGVGGLVYDLDPTAGPPSVAWKVTGEVLGLGMDRAASRLAVADPAGVTWVDLGTGRPAGRIPIDGLTGLVTVV